MPERTNKFGTFGGVFTPCTLTILGVIMFLRFGMVIGNAGIIHGLLIVLMAKVVTTLTALSLSAVATNTRIKGGGAYFLISRSLGVEFGGAIGLVFFLSQAISVALYVIGFTEALSSLSQTVSDNFRLVATVVNIAVFLCVFIGAGWTIKIQYFILAILALAIGSFALGSIGYCSIEQMQANMKPGYTEGQSIRTMFALFFPAATGVMAGANMSGDLANPSRSIPRGTLWAIFVTAIIYTSFALLLGISSSREQLQSDTMIVSKIAISSPFIIAGIFAATISSALGSMMGAPRILQAIARDRIFNIFNIFIPGSKKTGEPRRAIILSFIIAEIGVLLGDLNMIAPIITMFFLITYCALNFAAFREGISGNPSYRPTFLVRHWSISLLGAILCLAVMLLIDLPWAIAAILVMVGLYRHLEKHEIQSSWGDINSGVAFERVRRDLLSLEMEKYHPKNWRPTILAFEMHREEAFPVAAYARYLAGRYGLLLLGQVITSDAEGSLEAHSRALRMLRKRIAENELDAFPAVTISESTEAGIAALVQCCGIGAIRPNLILFNWPTNETEYIEVENSLKIVSRLGKSLAILKLNNINQDDMWLMPRGKVDVWWLGQSNGSLMVLLAHLLTTNNQWRGRSIRLIRVIKDQAGKDKTIEYLTEMAEEARIRVEPTVFVSEDFKECLQRESADSAMCILGMASPQEQPENILQTLQSIAGEIPRILFVHSSGDMSIEA